MWANLVKGVNLSCSKNKKDNATKYNILEGIELLIVSYFAKFHTAWFKKPSEKLF